MAKYSISGKAIADLSLIWNYTFDFWSEKQADKYYKHLIKSFETLSINPSIGKKYIEIDPDIKGYKVNRHVIFYRLIKQDEILILRILHERMDLKNRIDNSEDNQ